MSSKKASRYATEEAGEPFAAAPSGLYPTCETGKDSSYATGAWWLSIRFGHLVIALFYLASAILGFVLAPTEAKNYHIHTRMPFANFQMDDDDAESLVSVPSYKNVSAFHYRFIIPAMFAVGFLAHISVFLFFGFYRRLLVRGLQPQRWIGSSIMGFLLTICVAVSLGEVDITGFLAIGFVFSVICGSALAVELLMMWANTFAVNKWLAESKKGPSRASEAVQTATTDVMSAIFGKTLNNRLLGWGGVLVPLTTAVLAALVLLGLVSGLFGESVAASDESTPAYIIAMYVIYVGSALLVVGYFGLVVLNWYLNAISASWAWFADSRLNEMLLQAFLAIHFLGTGWAILGGIIHHY